MKLHLAAQERDGSRVWATADGAWRVSEEVGDSLRVVRMKDRKEWPASTLAQARRIIASQTQRRKNRGGQITDRSSTWRNARREEDYADIYKRWHWGIEPDVIYDWDDPDYPDALIEVGRLFELHVRMPDRRDKVIEIGKRYQNDAFVAFDPHHKYQRLYLLLPPAAQEDARRALWEGNRAPTQKLVDLALALHPGKAKHATRDYPDVDVKLVGALTDLVYRTHKKGDDDAQRGSSYIHALGEESKMLPALAVDRTGRLWIASGNMTSPTPGITD